jgi:threonine dehydrogenase-like Zn-dependent dehydrogenase
MVGCCAAALLARVPGVSVQMVDANPDRAKVAAAFRAGFASPGDAAAGRDLVLHASATAAGLQRSLELLAPEGTVIELSWYGDREVGVRLGESFHSGRLNIRSSQVGAVAPARRASRTFADRLALALELLRDPAFDTLFTGESSFDQLPDVLAAMAVGGKPALSHLITYSGV